MQEVTDQVVEHISNVYRENAPEYIYFITLYNIFNEFLEDLSEDVLPNEATGFKSSEIWNKLYNFQQDAALAIINKLEKFNGCILADSVGLGKTFTALAVIKYYENRNKSVLVLCPKKLGDNWITFRSNLTNNPIAKDRLRYDVLYHTDLSRDNGTSNGLPLDRINWGNYDLVVIDESHNFRNGGQIYGDEEKKENRYLKLLNKVIRTGVRTKVLMLSATPVNNRFFDLRNQLALAYEGEPEKIEHLLDTNQSIDDIFRQAQAAYNQWSKLGVEERTTNTLLDMLSFDFFELLDSVTIARSRKHIQKYYDTTAVGNFPTRLKPISIRPSLTEKNGAINYDEIYELLTQLNLSIYTPSEYVFPSRQEKYEKEYGRDMGNTFFRQSDREKGIQRLMNINLLKRLESSVHSFRLTVTKIKQLIDDTLETINSKNYTESFQVEGLVSENDLEIDDQNTDLFVGRKVKISLADMDTASWADELSHDSKILHELLYFVNDITPEHDHKLQTLLSVIDNKLEQPINRDNRKILIFTAFSDTSEYLYEHVSAHVKQQYGLNTALVSGSVEGRSTCLRLRNDMNTVLTCFSPISKQKELVMPGNHHVIDLLIATDCISEGQNLQDCDYLINYDIHWNPVRIIQRFGRVDRIGSPNSSIQLVNYWPDISLDEYINLKERVESRMMIADVTATGDDNVLSAQANDVSYRKEQLRRLQEEVIELEDLKTGVSITDLGLNDFRMDLLNYVKTHGELSNAPNGMHAVVPTKPEMGLPPGAIFTLRNRTLSSKTGDINLNQHNRLHPYYLVYISREGEVIHDHTEVKRLLDLVRSCCKGQDKPIVEACQRFNQETLDGRQMQAYSDLLGQSIRSMIEVKEEKDLDSLFSGGKTTALTDTISGLDDFELISFIVIQGGE